LHGAAALAASAVVGFTLTRTTGLPQAGGDIGNWSEPLGLASLFVEGAVIAISGYALAAQRPVRALARTSAPQRAPPPAEPLPNHYPRAATVRRCRTSPSSMGRPPTSRWWPSPSIS
jgi:hypothetical protein